MTDTHEKITPSSGCVFADLGVERPDYAEQCRTAIAFLKEAERYFHMRPTGGEDNAHWANIFNAEECGKIAALIDGFPHRISQANQDGIREGKRQAADLIERGFEKPVGKRYREDGAPSKHDHCVHGLYMYEDCEQCAVLAILSTITDESE